MPSMFDPKRPRIFVPRLVLRDLVPLVLLLALVEVSLQVWCPQYRDRNFDHELTGNHPIGLNQHGLRGPEVPYLRKPNELRVLALGDSTTFGTGLPFEATWPGQLGKIGESEGRALSSVNAGKPGASVSEMVVAYEKEWQKYDAQVVVLALSNNMISLEWIRQGDEVIDLAQPGVAVLSSKELAIVQGKRWLHRLCLPSAIGDQVERLLYFTGVASHNLEPEAPFGPFLAFGWRQIGLDPEMSPKAWELLSKKIAQLATLVHLRGAELYITMLPSRFQLTDLGSDNTKSVPIERFTVDPVLRTRELAKGLGLRFIDVQQALRQRRLEDPKHPDLPELYLTADFTHLDEEGSRTVAAEVHRSLRESSVW
jgi:hypothetical protein